MTLCKYNNSLGKPNEGIHFHVFGIAIVDLFLTIVACYFLAKWRKWNFYMVFFIAVIIAILLHRLFCVNSTINKLIFGSV